MKHTIKMVLIMCGFLSLPFSQAHAAPLLINGAGATFPYPIYSKWFTEYRKVDASVNLNYQSIGSGGGITRLTDGTVDFGASDAPMKDDEISKLKNGVIHIPTVIGAVVVSYHLPGVSDPLQLTGEVVSSIFLGDIKKWNDPKIQSLNPSVKLPESAITVVNRSDGSGTTHVFTEYLGKVNPDWTKRVGVGKAVTWPSGGIGAKGNEGVTASIKQTPGAIGYVELVYAIQNKLAHAKIKNKAGEFTAASMESVTKAAAGVVKILNETDKKEKQKKKEKDTIDDFRVSITDAPGKGVYPISSFTYLLFPLELPKDKGEKMVQFMKWGLGKEAQKMAFAIGFSPLPDLLVKRIEKNLNLIKIAK